MRKLNQSGFTAIEAVLIIVILVIIGGTGWYVWHSKQATEKALTSANQSAQNLTVNAHKKSTTSSNASTPVQNQKYLVVKEWGVKFPYTGNDTYSYNVPAGSNGNVIEVISASLAQQYPGCDTFGAGIIARGKATDTYAESPDDPNATTYQAAYQQDQSTIGKAGNYYFAFHHDQAACADNPTDASTQAQNAASQAVAAIVPKVILSN